MICTVIALNSQQHCLTDRMPSPFSLRPRLSVPSPVRVSPPSVRCSCSGGLPAFFSDTLNIGSHEITIWIRIFNVTIVKSWNIETIEHFPCRGRNIRESLYRVTIPLVQNLPLTSKQKFRFGPGLSLPGQAKTELLFWSQREVLNKWNCHPVVTYVTAREKVSMTVQNCSEEFVPEWLLSLTRWSM